MGQRKPKSFCIMDKAKLREKEHFPSEMKICINFTIFYVKYC